ncbi:hypothetical protein [Sedimentitalea nanhaiensis]|uniref:Uncharacterized protein n=1 Tax=Sedimentitalea nanhaiensis TaxID=999627 RepID=A0A1I6XBI6_9RHOB|nr:hypothetical protein [Sedimentitalea nanhaiensis]SFT35709.1 hypothetical protein SAMN05216236_101193 [Sedimentitalea nanhaiensis]
MTLHKTSLLIAVLAAFSAVVTPADAAGFKRIKSADDFNSKIVGKTLASGKSAFVLQPNGAITGSSPGGKVVGKWNWQKGYYCRALRIGKKEYPSDCQTVYFDGSDFYSVGQQGKGDKSPVFSVK